MFDEDKINELLRGASPKKKNSSKRKDPPQKKESPDPTPTKTKEITQEELQEIGNMIGSAAAARHPATQQKKTEEKRVSSKKLQNRQEYIHEQKLAEDRLRRLKHAEKRIEELERERRETANRIA